MPGITSVASQTVNALTPSRMRIPMPVIVPRPSNHAYPVPRADVPRRCSLIPGQPWNRRPPGGRSLGRRPRHRFHRARPKAGRRVFRITAASAGGAAGQLELDRRGGQVSPADRAAADDDAEHLGWDAGEPGRRCRQAEHVGGDRRLRWGQRLKKDEVSAGQQVGVGGDEVVADEQCGAPGGLTDGGGVTVGSGRCPGPGAEAERRWAVADRRADRPGAG